MNEIEQLQDILDAILDAIQEMIQSGEELSDELSLLAAEEINFLVSEIDRLSQEQIGQINPTEPAPHASSNINGFKYDDKTGQLLVKFQGDYPQQNGPVYSYSDVPKFIFDIFKRGAVAPKTSGKNAWHEWKKGVTPSLGAAMDALIKRGGYQYQRVS